MNTHTQTETTAVKAALELLRKTIETLPLIDDDAITSAFGNLNDAQDSIESFLEQETEK